MPLRSQLRNGPVTELPDRRFDDRLGSLQRSKDASPILGSDRRDQDAIGRERPREEWHEDRPDPELLGEGPRVHRPGAAEGEQCKIPRVKAATREDQPHRLRHRGFDNPLDAEDRFVPGKMQRRCEGLNPFCSEGLVERKPSSEETRSKGPTDQVGSPLGRAEKSALVPPMSKVTRFLEWLPRDRAAPAATPPAGPLRTKSTGRLATAEWTATPPPDFITKKSFRIAALNSVR